MRKHLGPMKNGATFFAFLSKKYEKPIDNFKLMLYY